MVPTPSTELLRRIFAALFDAVGRAGTTACVLYASPRFSINKPLELAVPRLACPAVLVISLRGIARLDKPAVALPVMHRSGIVALYLDYSIVVRSATPFFRLRRR